MEKETLFTQEAQRLLEEESDDLRRQLRQQAIDEALRARGKPIEVTASDVRRARLQFIKRDAPLLPSTDLLLRLYAVMGVLLTLGGALYPVVRPLLDQRDPTVRISLAVSLMGVSLLVISLLGRYLLRARHEMASRRILERYEREREESRAIQSEGSTQHTAKSGAQPERSSGR